MTPRMFARVLLPALAISLAAPAGAFAKWQGITPAENRIVFASDRFAGYREVHRYRPFKANHYTHENYMVRWTVGGRRLPVFRLYLQLLAPGRHFQGGTPTSLEGTARGLNWVEGLSFAASEAGTAETVLGSAEHLIFEAGRHRCGLFRLFANKSGISDPDTLGNIAMSGLYCPLSGEIDARAVESVLARVGIRDIAMPAPDAPAGNDLARLVTSGDLAGLRRAAGEDFDPDTLIPFSHPRFAGGRTIRRPMIVAASLFGRAGPAAFLIERGASVEGQASGAICAAIATNHPDIVDLLLEREPALAQYDRCGRGRNLSPVALARRLGHDSIAERLETGSR